jgi:hypothetical protein
MKTYISPKPSEVLLLLVFLPDINGVHQTAEEMDDIRQRNMAYEYLCHLEEAKKLEDVY